MKKTISYGQWRGLKDTSVQNRFAIMAFDQRGSYRRMFDEPVDFETAVHIKSEIVVPLSYHVSAVLLDPVYGLDAAMHMDGKSGLLLALEKTGYSGNSTYRQVDFIEDWSVHKIKQVGASAVKLLVYYHPDNGELTQEIENVVRNVVEMCEAEDIALFLEPVTYSIDENMPKNSAAFAETRPRVVLETAKRLSQLGATMLKLEFPVDSQYESNHDKWLEACQAVSDVCDVPWVLLSAGVDFEVFRNQTEIACKSGASGFLAGRAIWKEAVALSTEERAEFLSTVATDRIQQLSSLVDQFARPWTDFYELNPIKEGWYADYAIR